MKQSFYTRVLTLLVAVCFGIGSMQAYQLTISPTPGSTIETIDKIVFDADTYNWQVADQITWSSSTGDSGEFWADPTVIMDPVLTVEGSGYTSPSNKTIKYFPAGTVITFRVPDKALVKGSDYSEAATFTYTLGSGGSVTPDPDPFVLTSTNFTEGGIYSELAPGTTLDFYAVSANLAPAYMAWDIYDGEGIIAMGDIVNNSGAFSASFVGESIKFYQGNNYSFKITGYENSADRTIRTNATYENTVHFQGNTAAPSTYVELTVSPSGSQTSLSNITLSYGSTQLSEPTNSSGISLRSPSNEVIAPDDVTVEGNNLVLSFPKQTATGEYVLTIPQGVIKVADNTYNSSIYHTITVVASVTPPTPQDDVKPLFFTPDPGTSNIQQDLEKVEAYNSGYNISLNPNFSGEPPYVLASANHIPIKVTFNNNRAVLTVDGSIGYNGPISVVIPEGYFLLENTTSHNVYPNEYSAASYIHLSSTAASSPKDLKIDPTPESTTPSLSHFTLDYVSGYEYYNVQPKPGYADNPAYIICPDHSRVYLTAKSDNYSGTTRVTLSLPELISEAGEYTLVIPENTFYITNASYTNIYTNNEASIIYTVQEFEYGDEESSPLHTIPPVGSTVTAIPNQIRVLDDPDVMWWAVNPDNWMEEGADIEPYIVNELGEKVGYIGTNMWGYTPEENVYRYITILDLNKQNTTITTPGIYTVIIPPKRWMFGDPESPEVYNDKLHLTWYVQNDAVDLEIQVDAALHFYSRKNKYMGASVDGKVIEWGLGRMEFNFSAVPGITKLTYNPALTEPVKIYEKWNSTDQTYSRKHTWYGKDYEVNDFAMSLPVDEMDAGLHRLVIPTGFFRVTVNNSAYQSESPMSRAAGVGTTTELWPEDTKVMLFTSAIPTGLTDLMIEEAPEYRVYNMLGIEMMHTTDANDLLTLPAGIYVINGEKVAIR